MAVYLPLRGRAPVLRGRGSVPGAGRAADPDPARRAQRMLTAAPGAMRYYEHNMAWTAIPAAFAGGMSGHFARDPEAELVARCRALSLPDPPFEVAFKKVPAVRAREVGWAPTGGQLLLNRR
jgi:hypothetical protein